MTLTSPDRATAPRFPDQPLLHLDTLWVQVGGSLCNLACTHCFVSCGPDVHRHEQMSRATVWTHVADAVALGVKEVYFTGGEPFLHPELLDILADTLAVAPATVLTNGTLLPARTVDALVELGGQARHSLELRVSLDGPTPAEHERFRGAGNFERVLTGIVRLSAAGLLPIVTVTHAPDVDRLALRERYLELLRARGVSRPRLKLLPLFKHGRAAALTGGYVPVETLAGLAPEAFDPTRLQCAHGRAVTGDGAYVCPLLVDEPAARMGARLAAASGPFTLRHGACYTCHVTGMTCGNG